MKIEDAVKKLTSEIEKDAVLRESYKTNIAMAFYYECIKNQVDDDLPLQLLHEIAHKAADNFLNSWCIEANNVDAAQNNELINYNGHRYM